MGGILTVEGTGKVCQEDTDVEYLMRSKEEWIQEYTRLCIAAGITEIGPGFLETFAFMEELTIHYSVKTIAMTPELKSLLTSRKVVIFGWRDSAGERLAQELGLKFVQAEIFVGWFRSSYSSTKLIIKFDRECPYLYFDEYSQGSSAGSCGGGSWEEELAKDFPVGVTLESFAMKHIQWDDEIMSNKDLKYYLEHSQQS